MTDYGYWYKPDGRLPDEQQLFEQVEAKPQAIEWIFSVAAGIKFCVSADNLAGNQEMSTTFKANIYEHAINYLHNGLPPRAEQFKNQLLGFYHQDFNLALFKLNNL